MRRVRAPICEEVSVLLMVVGLLTSAVHPHDQNGRNLKISRANIPTNWAMGNCDTEEDPMVYVTGPQLDMRLSELHKQINHQ